MNLKKTMTVCMASTMLMGSVIPVNAAEKEVIKAYNE